MEKREVYSILFFFLFTFSFRSIAFRLVWKGKARWIRSVRNFRAPTSNVGMETFSWYAAICICMCARARVCVCVCIYRLPPLFLFLTEQQVKDFSRLLIGEKTSKFSIFIIFQKARNSTFYMKPAPWTRCFFKTVIHLAVSLKTAANWHSSLYLALLFFLFILLSPAPSASLHRFEKKRYFFAYNRACTHISRSSESVRDWNRFAAGCLVNSFLNAQSRPRHVEDVSLSIQRSYSFYRIAIPLSLSTFMSLLFLLFFFFLFYLKRSSERLGPFHFANTSPPKVPPHYC